MKLTTNSGRTMEIGKRPAKVKTFTPPAGAHLYGLRGSYGKDCAAPSVQLVWGTETCAEVSVRARMGSCWGPEAHNCQFVAPDSLACGVSISSTQHSSCEV